MNSNKKIQLNYTLSTPFQMYNLTCAGYTDFDTQMQIVYDSYITSLPTQQKEIANTIYPSYPKDLFPLAVRYVSPDKNIYIIERPPFQIPIDFSGTKSYNLRKPVRAIQNKTMWVPWTVTLIQFDSAHTSVNYYLYFNDGPLTSLQDILIPCFFPNSSGGHICMGNDTSAAIKVYKETESITQLYNYFFNSYFSGWNCDLMNDIPNYEYLISNFDLINRIKSNSGQKSIKIFEKDYLYNTKNIYTRMFLLLSHMTLPEIISYISECKKQKLSSSRKPHYFNYCLTTQNNIDIPQHTDYFHNPYYQYIYPQLTVSGSFSHTNHKRIRVVINKYDKSLVDSYPSNSYLIYLLYKFHNENLNNDFTSLNYAVDHSQISPYLTEVENNEYAN